MNLGTGITGSVVGSLYGTGGSMAGGTTAFAPPPATYPENNQTVTAAAFGPQGVGGGGGLGPGIKSSWIATGAFILLVAFWYSLPR